MAFTKAGLWGPQAIIDSTGHPQPGAAAALYLPDEVTLASLWTTSAKSVALANPTQADIHANLHFYADPGQYRLRVNVGTVVTWLDVEVPIDPSEAAQDQDVVAAQAAAEAYADGIVAAGLATKQPLDADLTAIAALATTAFGRGLLILADAAAGRVAFGSVIGTDVQAHDSDLDAIAALATTAFGRALLVLADAAALRTAAGLGTAATHATGDFDAAGTASAAVTALVAGAPGALDTLNELATALADDANFATTITNALAGKQQAVARTAVKTTNYSAAAGDLVPVDTTSGAVTVTLPNAPTDKSTIAVKHIIQGGTNVVTIACAGADVFNRAGGGTTATLPYANQAMLLEYTAAGAIWSVIADDLPLSQLDLRFAPITGIPESAVTSLATDLAAKAPILIPTAVKTGNYTAAVGDYVLADTSGGIFTVTLPTAPADKTSIAVDLVVSGNTLTIARGGADVFQKAGGPTSLTMNTANRVLVLQYQSSIAVWHVQDHLPAVINTKGDLLTYSTERARLAVGADGALLGADSTQATGLKWIPSGTYASATARLALSTYVSAGVLTPTALGQAISDAISQGKSLLVDGQWTVTMTDSGDVSNPARIAVTDDLVVEGLGRTRSRIKFGPESPTFAFYGLHVSAGKTLTVRNMRVSGPDNAGPNGGLNVGTKGINYAGGPGAGTIRIEFSTLDGQFYDGIYVDNAGNDATSDITVEINHSVIRAYGQDLAVFSTSAGTGRVHCDYVAFRDSGKAAAQVGAPATLEQVYIHPHLAVRMDRCTFADCVGYAFHHYSGTIPSTPACPYAILTDTVVESTAVSGFLTTANGPTTITNGVFFNSATSLKIQSSLNTTNCIFNQTGAASALITDVTGVSRSAVVKDRGSTFVVNGAAQAVQTGWVGSIWRFSGSIFATANASAHGVIQAVDACTLYLDHCRFSGTATDHVRSWAGSLYINNCTFDGPCGTADIDCAATASVDASVIDSFFNNASAGFNVKTSGVGNPVRGRGNFFAKRPGAGTSTIANLQARPGVGANIASATSIAPTYNFDTYHVTGTTAISTMLMHGQADATRACAARITLIADGAWSTTTGGGAGGFAEALTAVATKAYVFQYDPTAALWYHVQ